MFRWLVFEKDCCGACRFNLLENEWSLVPRLYSILRKIGQLDAIDAFIDSDVTDVYFPFTKSTLPEALRDHSVRLRFLELQHLVYNKEALNLERHAPHGHFSDPTEVPLKKVGELGKGGFGYVDRVVSTISHQEYARKLIPRGRTFKKDREVLKDFTRELSNLKQLSHKHLVELVGSYTDNRYVAIVMLPVADTNLQTFLERAHLDERSRSFLRPFFGCLTSALCYLHDNRIRHKDIKRSNVLIKGDQVYFTDFGTALDWSDRGSSITLTAWPTTPRYCAPEVMAYTQRNSSSDIWSFGCVFLEMWTVLRCHTLEDLRTHMAAHGSGAREYHSNLEATTGWIEILRYSSGPSSDLIPSTWIANMLQREPTDRWDIHTLDNRIGEACVDSLVQHMFKGMCCLEHEDDLSEDTWSLAEESEDRSTAPLQPQHTSESTTTIASSEGLGLGQTVPTIVSEDEGALISLGRLNQSAEAERNSLVHNVTECRVHEAAARFVFSPENSLGHIVIDRDEASTPKLASSYTDAGIGEMESRRETGIKYDIPPSSGLIEQAGAPIHDPSQSNSPFCYWDVAFEGEDDDITDDETLHLREPTSEFASHALIPHQLSSYHDEAAVNFEEHARVCGYCKHPLEVFRRHGKLCVEGFRLAKRLLAFVSKSNGRVYGVRMIGEKADPIGRCILEVVYIPPSYHQVKGLLKAIERSKRCSGNYVFLARYCEDPEHRYWQELYPCPRCKRPLGSETRKLVDNGELVHKRCRRSFEDRTGDWNSGNKKEPQSHLRPLPRYPAPASKQSSARDSGSSDLMDVELPRPERRPAQSSAQDFNPSDLEHPRPRASPVRSSARELNLNDLASPKPDEPSRSRERSVLKKSRDLDIPDSARPGPGPKPSRPVPAKSMPKKTVFGSFVDRVLHKDRCVESTNPTRPESTS